MYEEDLTIDKLIIEFDFSKEMNDNLGSMCTYCHEASMTTKKWEQTGEMVCFDCRVELLQTEFKNYTPVYEQYAKRRVII